MSNRTDVLVALGNYRFSLNSAAPQEIDEELNFRWIDIDVVNDMPVSQFNGHGLKPLVLRGVIYPFHAGGFEQIELIEAEAIQGEPLRLVMGTGHDKGLFTIRKITQRKKMLFVKGSPRKIEFTIELMSHRNDTAS